MIALGFDPSSNGGAAWALLRVTPSERVYLEHGECATTEDATDLVINSLGGYSRGGGPCVIGIEIPVGGLGTKRGDDAGSRKRGEHLIATATVASYLHGYIAGAWPFLPVYTMPSYAARKHLSLGGIAPKTDAQVEAALRVVVPNWPGPRKTTNHHRDAAAVAFAAAIVSMTTERRASGT